MRALPYSRTARERFNLDDPAIAAAPATGTGNGTATAASARAARAAANLPAARRVVAAVNAARPAGETSAPGGGPAALHLLHEIFPLLVGKAAELEPPVGIDSS